MLCSATKELRQQNSKTKLRQQNSHKKRTQTICACRLDKNVQKYKLLRLNIVQFVIFKRQSYCFEETIGLDVKTSFASRPESRLIR